MITLPPPRMTEADANRAYDEWQFNCGPAAICAILNKTPDEIRPFMGDFESKGYTNPTLMVSTLERLGVKFRRHVVGSKFVGATCTFVGWPTFGLARVQWEGPWTAPGVPMRARYRHTHWVAAVIRSRDDVGIFDVNCMNNGTGWIRASDWKSIVVPHIIQHCVPRGNGQWHLTHQIEVTR